MPSQSKPDLYTDAQVCDITVCAIMYLHSVIDGLEMSKLLENFWNVWLAVHGPNVPLTARGKPRLKDLEAYRERLFKHIEDLAEPRRGGVPRFVRVKRIEKLTADLHRQIMSLPDVFDYSARIFQYAAALR